MKRQDIQYFELETSVALQDALLTDDEPVEYSSASSSSSSSILKTDDEHHTPLSYRISSSSFNGCYNEHIRSLGTFLRYVAVAVAGLVLVAKSPIVSSTTARISSAPQHPPTVATNHDNDHRSILFGIHNVDDPRYCVIQPHLKLDVGFQPYATQVDRSHCEKYNSHLRWSQDLRCYDLKTRWCFVTLQDGFTIEELEYHHHGCQSKFYEKNGILYRYDGNPMPDSFWKQCSEPETQIWYSVQPKTGCGKVPLRFCREDGLVHWDLVHLHKQIANNNALSLFQYNCREFQLIDLLDEGSEDSSQMEELCREQVQGCANRLYRGCDGDGKISQELINNDDEGECLQFDELDSNLAGYETDQGVDLICLST